ncbi:hypothetical protein EAH89_02285 [Roseomonas nepalensis]|uniref:Uncharacterized protein n=1 Tax=Muricoccus nepalensis TaxID=1854500 RepID=A0A502GET1_9PROT|nr:hypothetical protein [Roseomonas nepalensis]TPG60241.1 hypothetical protein EAH89_02285 [Roseomonas nepalensis]
MPDLLHPQERDRLLAALRRRLRRAALDGRPLSGLARTEAPGAPLALRDNALAAEAMAIPALREADPGLADTLLHFLTAVAEEPGAPSRAVRPAEAEAAARVEILRDNPADLRVLTPWHEFTGDLAHGLLRQRMRDEPSASGEAAGRRGVLHSGNMARLRAVGGVPGLLGRLSLRARTLDVEDAITAAGVQPEGAGALLWHESALRLRPLPGVSLPIGTLRYEYRVSAADPLLRLTVVLRAGTRAGLAALRLTTAADALSEAEPPFAHASLGRDGGQVPRAEGPFGEDELLAQGPLDSLHLWQSGPAEEALALHLRPRAGEAVFSARLRGREGAPHWLVLRHALPDLAPGGTATLREDRLLARGVAHGTPAAALRLLRDPAALAGRDPGQAGIGAPLAAVAATLLNAPAFAHPIPRDRLGALQDWLDRQVAALPEEEAAALPLEETALLVLALDAAWRLGGLPGDRRRLRALLARLVAAAGPEGPAGADLAGRGAAILALARGGSLIPEPWVLDALRHAVLALDPAALSPPPATRALAAVLRGLRAVEYLAGTGRIPPDAAVLARAAALREASLAALSGRLRAEGDRLEVLAEEGGEADAPSTAALLLAVLSPDEAALSMGMVTA